jgi:hypothetical protein
MIGKSIGKSLAARSQALYTTLRLAHGLFAAFRVWRRRK